MARMTGPDGAVMYGQHFQQSMDQPGKAANPARGQLNRKKCFFSCPRSRLRIWPHETGSAVPSRVSPLILHTQGESDWLVLTHGIPPAFRDGVSNYVYRQSPSGRPQVYRVTQLRADGVHCREFAGTGPVVLKVVRVTSTTFSGITMDQSMCASLFPHTLLICM